MLRGPEKWHSPAFGNFCVASCRSFASRACWRCRRRFSFFRFSFAACLPRGFRDFMLPYQGEQGSGSTRRTPAIHANYTPINAPTPEVWGQRTRTPRARILASHTRLTCAMKPTWPGDAAAVSSTAASRTRAADVNALPHVRTMGAGGSHLLVRPSGAGQYCASFAFGVRVELSSRFPPPPPPHGPPGLAKLHAAPQRTKSECPRAGGRLRPERGEPRVPAVGFNGQFGYFFNPGLASSEPGPKRI